MVVEFSPATASAMGLAWAYHEHCRADMEADFLPALFRHGRDVARCGAAAAAAAGADEAGVCAAAISLLCAVLSWDFRCISLRHCSDVRRNWRESVRACSSAEACNSLVMLTGMSCGMQACACTFAGVRWWAAQQ